MELAVATTGPRAGAVAVARARRRLDGYELGLLGIFAAVSVWVLALDLWQVVAHGRVWTGTDGFFIVDQLQYLAWIRGASHHLLASNLFVLRPTPADYFQPAVAISGIVSAFGVSPWLSLLMWKPVAVAATFFAVRAYVYRCLGGRWERRAALALALFYGSFSVVYGSFGVVGDLFPGFLSWGYPFGLMALAAMLAALLAYEHDRREGRLSWKAPLWGALAASLHPWQGELLVILIVGAELASLRDGARLRLRLRMAAATIIATTIPLVYYATLGHLDVSWGLAREASKHTFSFWSIAIAIAPLAVVAALGYRGSSRSFLALLTRVWPLAALVIYILSASSLSATPLHAFEGITFPLSVLALDGLRRSGWRRVPRHTVIGAVALALATIPASAYELAIAHQYMGPTPGNANFITRDERSALDYLSDSHATGGVLTRFYLGALVPARTGRRTFVGNCLWSEPECSNRAVLAQQLIDGTLPSRVARSFVSSSGARFVLTDCQTMTDLRRVLGPLLVAVHRFGCATVYELVGPNQPVGPLAESPIHAAALRTPGRQ